MSRNLYTFGCSYTTHYWPTWPVFSSVYFDKVINYGNTGGGNNINFLSFVNLVSLGVIQSGDTVVIQWGSLLRELRIFSNKTCYETPGNVLNQTTFDYEGYVLKYFNPLEKAFELISYIESVISICTEKNINVKMFYMLPPWIGEFLGEPSDTSLIPRHWLDNLNNSKALLKLQELSKSEHFFDYSLEEHNLEVENTNTLYTQWYNFNPHRLHADHHPNPTVHLSYTFKYLTPWFQELFNQKYNGEDKLKDIAQLWDDKLSDKEFLGEIYYTLKDKTQDITHITLPMDFKKYTNKLRYVEDEYNTQVYYTRILDTSSYSNIYNKNT